MPDFAVRIPFNATNGLAGPLGQMVNGVRGFGREAGAAFDHAGRRVSLFSTLLKSQLVTGLIQGGPRMVTRAIRSIPEGIADFASRAEAIGIQADKIGITADAFQRLSYAASITDVPVDNLATGMEFMNKNMGQLTARVGPLQSMLGKVNPALARQLTTANDSKEAFLLIADAVSQTTDAQTRAAIVTTVFGQAGQDLIPILSQGRTGLHQLMEEASVYGSVLSDEVVEQSGALDDTITRLRGSMASLKDTALAALVRAVSPYVGRLTEWVGRNRELIGQRVQSWIDGIGNGIRWVGATIGPYIQQLRDWWAANKDLVVTDVRGFIEGIGETARQVAPIIRGIGDAIAWTVGAAKDLEQLVSFRTTKNPRGFFETLGDAMGLPGPESWPGATGGSGMERHRRQRTALAMPGPQPPNAADALNTQSIIAQIQAQQSPLGVYVDNSRAPGTQTNIRTAPTPTGAAGSQYRGGR